MIDRLKQIAQLDGIILAISDGDENLAFADYATTWGVPYVLGNEEDVLSRYIHAAHHVDADILLRVTTENPFIYIGNLDEMISRHVQIAADLTVCEMLPDGAYSEIVTVAALEKAAESSDLRHHEHSTLFIFENPDAFKIEKFQAPAELSRPDIRLTIDTPEDLIVARRVYAGLEAEFGSSPPLNEIIKYLDEHNDLRAMNAHLRPQSTKLWH